MASKDNESLEPVVGGLEELSLDELDGVRGGFRANREHRPGSLHQAVRRDSANLPNQDPPRADTRKRFGFNRTRG